MKIRVQSIFTKIVVWAVATVVISLIGFVVTSAFVSARISGRSTNSARLSAMFLDDARRALQEGGPKRLDALPQATERPHRIRALSHGRPRNRPGDRRGSIGAAGPRARRRTARRWGDSCPGPKRPSGSGARATAGFA